MYADLSPLHFCGQLAKSETEPETAAFTGSAFFSCNHIEFVKDARMLAMVDPLALVADQYLDMCAQILDRDLNGRSDRRIFERIIQQVGENTERSRFSIRL